MGLAHTSCWILLIRNRAYDRDVRDQRNVVPKDLSRGPVEVSACRLGGGVSCGNTRGPRALQRLDAPHQLRARPAGLRHDLRELFDRMGQRLDVGLLRNGGTQFAGRAAIDLDFLLGKNGGHLNVNGIAGLGTKSTLLMSLNWLSNSHRWVCMHGIARLGRT